MKYFCHAILRIIGATDEIIFIAFEAPTDYVMTTLLVFARRLSKNRAQLMSARQKFESNFFCAIAYKCRSPVRIIFLLAFHLHVSTYFSFFR